MPCTHVGTPSCSGAGAAWSVSGVGTRSGAHGACRKFWTYARHAVHTRKGALNQTLIAALYSFSLSGGIHPCFTAKSMA